ncbi:MAG TPA: PorP/SprF family type IX secretion system membrane protein [Brumimicrobium sp.]|nr:PorP/SprF family type IX secretion system membrane protein [Brumimicrobium sp.]
MKNIQLIISMFIFMVFIHFSGNTQDVHFSQFWNTPLLQNPSFAGKSQGAIRAIANYRTQWASVTPNQFSSYGANFDMRFSTSPKENHFAGGISMYTDMAGSSKMRTTLVNLTAAYHLKVSNGHFLSAGLQGGINQKGIDANELRFDNQFDGTEHNAGIHSNENLSSISEIRPTVSAGVSYLWSNTFGQTNSRRIKERSINIGFAIHHFNAPQLSILTQENLGLKYVGNFEASFQTSSSWKINPLALVAIQNKATDIVFGSMFIYPLAQGSQLTDFNKSSSIGFGAYYRFKDAIIPAVQVQWAAFSVGLSYDVNLSQLSGASNNRGGFEINLKYVSENSIIGRQSRARFL